MNVPPEFISKAPSLGDFVFGGDPNGISGGLLHYEGEKWQKQRKIISKMLHLNILEEYIETMDQSGIRFIRNMSLL